MTDENEKVFDDAMKMTDGLVEDCLDRVINISQLHHYEPDVIIFHFRKKLNKRIQEEGLNI